MARNVFYSFHYQNDIFRVMIVRNRWVTYGGQMVSGVIDHVEFEKIQCKGSRTVKDWINDQLHGTSATIVLIGSETLNRPYVQYEIRQSMKKGNALIGVYINNLKDSSGNISLACNRHTCIGYNNNTQIYFDRIATIYDYCRDDGYNNLNLWIESAVKNIRN